MYSLTRTVYAKKGMRVGNREIAVWVEGLLERFGLAQAADRLVRTYSGGMLRRVDLIASLIIAPTVLFLDEPTTGLDPRSRSEVWDGVRELAAEGTTVLLTTQYLEEDDRLAGGIAVIDSGRVIASGTPDELNATIGHRLDVVVRDAAELGTAARVRAVLGPSPPHRRTLLIYNVKGGGVAVTPELPQRGDGVPEREMRRLGRGERGVCGEQGATRGRRRLHGPPGEGGGLGERRVIGVLAQ